MGRLGCFEAQYLLGSLKQPNMESSMSILTLERDGDLAVLTLNNPPVNAFSAELGRELRDALREIATGDYRALLTCAAGENFCAGADVKVFSGQTQRTGAGMVADVLNLIEMIETLPIPTVVAVQGLAIAAGMELMLAHDIAIAADSAQIGQIEAMIGTTTLAGGVQRIAARAGVARAKQMVFEARRYDAATLERWNIVNMVVPAAELQAKARQYAQRLASGPTVAHAVTKSVVNAYMRPAVGSADEALRAGAPKLFETDDKRQAVSLFLEMGSRAFAEGRLTYNGR